MLKYLEKICSESKDYSLKKYESIIEPELLKKIETKIKISKTTDGIKSLDSSVKLDDFKKYSNTICLQFEEKNKKVFKRNE